MYMGKLGNHNCYCARISFWWAIVDKIVVLNNAIKLLHCAFNWVWNRFVISGKNELYKMILTGVEINIIDFFVYCLYLYTV